MTHTDTNAVFRAIYSINSVTTSDSGTYTCTVTNPIGSDSETITVNVGGKSDYYYTSTRKIRKFKDYRHKSSECLYQVTW